MWQQIRMHLRQPTRIQLWQPIRMHLIQPIRIHLCQPIRIQLWQPIRMHLRQPIRIHLWQPIRVHVWQPTRIHVWQPIRKPFCSPRSRSCQHFFELCSHWAVDEKVGRGIAHSRKEHSTNKKRFNMTCEYEKEFGFLVGYDPVYFSINQRSNLTQSINPGYLLNGKSFRF